MVFFTSRGIVDSDTAIGDLDVETEILLNENGTPVNYLIVNQGLPSDIYDASCEGTWCLRKDIAENRVWDSGNSNVLETSDIQTYLNGDWMNRYDPDVTEAIKQVKIPYRQGGGTGGTDQSGANGLSCKAFLLSAKEVGFSHSDAPNDGKKLDYFISGNTSSAKQKRIATLDGNNNYWMNRSPYIAGTERAFCVTPDGNYTHYWTGSPGGIRPCIILPFDFKIRNNQIVS